VIVLYAVAASPLPTTSGSVAGIDDVPVRSEVCGRLHAIVSEHPNAPVRDVEVARTHAAVVAEVGHLVASVPVRFGSWHADEASLRAALADREHELLASIHRVGGHVEFVVRKPATRAASQPAPAGPAAATTGRAYLEDRLADLRARRAEDTETSRRLAEVTAALEPLASEHRTVRGRLGPERCFLVAAADTRRFAATVREITAGTDLLSGGPWPPYTFAGDDHAGAARRDRPGP
jgi:hypothetical protein